MKQRLGAIVVLAVLTSFSALAQSQQGPVLQRRPTDPNSAPTPVYTPDQQQAQPGQQPQQYPQPAQPQNPQPQQQPYPQQPQYPQSQQPYPQQQQYPPYQPAYGAPNVVPSGATFLVRMKDNLDTNKLSTGKKFTAELGEDLLAPDGSVLIPHGRKLHGHVTEVDRGGLHSRVMLSFYEIESRHGWVPLVATVNSVPGQQGVAKVGEEGEISRSSSTRREIEAAGVGAAIGAASGAAWGGGKGAAIGAGAGATVGAVGGLVTGRDVRISKGDPVELRLERDLRVPTS